MKKLLLVAILLVTFSAGSFAQNGGGGWLNGWINTWADLIGGPYTTSIAYLECHNGEMFYVTYRIYSSGPLAGTMIVQQATDAGYKCDCSNGGSTTRPASASGFSALQPRETECTSDNGMGQQVTVPGQEATGSMSSWGGPSNLSPLPPLGAPDRQPIKHQVSARAAAPGSTFTFTLPFRDLPSGPLVSEVTSPIPWQCNSTVNPTFFRVFHVSNVVTRYSLCPVSPIATIPVPDLPLQIRVTPDGSQAIVTSYSGAITFINTATNAVSGTIQTPTNPNFAPDGVAISPDGSYALVTNYLAPPDNYLAVVDTASMKITNQIPLNTEYPESVFINPDGTLAWVTHPWDNAVEVVDILTGTLVQQLEVIEPFSIVFNLTGTRAFVSSGSGSVEVFDTSTYDMIKSVPADLGAMDLLISPDGAYVTVNNSLAQTVTVINTQSLTANTTNIGGMPQGAALVPSQ